MNFPTEQQREEYSAYFVSSLNIFRKKFREMKNRDPLEFELVYEKIMEAASAEKRKKEADVYGNLPEEAWAR